jgi:dihydropyrimidinase
MGVLWSEGVAKGRLSVDRFVELTSSGPAKVFGLYPQKGALLPGCDADIVVLDPALRQKLTLDALHSDCDYSVWDGWECNGYPRTTIARGEVLVRDGAWVGAQHRGRFVRCGVPAGRA